MRRGLRAALVVLFLVPFVLILLVAGILFLWENPWLLKWLWVPIPICWIAMALLYRFGKRRFGAIWKPSLDPMPHWTDRDREAWKIVERYADDVVDASADRYFAKELYIETAEELATRLATHYHPEANDPVESLTIPEILTAAELAISDLRQFVELYIPGSHLLTIRWLKRAPKISNAWNRFKPIYYAASVVWHPWTIVSRAAVDGTVMTPVMDQLKQEGMAGLFRAFILQLGKYTIELNSHRLKVGPEQWRALMERPRDPSAARDATAVPAATTGAEPTLQIVVAGQVKAGKSSVINALIGRQQAAVDVLPLTAAITAYAVRPKDVPAELVLLDTVGYAHEGLRADRVNETMRAVRESAMLLLVINACDPAREPDCAFVRSVEAWFRAHPQCRRPPILAVVTHIDDLPPSREWNPPYDGWLRPNPAGAKQRNIRMVVQDVQRLLGPSVAAVVPACTDVERARVHGIDQWVVPAFLNLLPQARAKQMVDVLYAERDKRRLAKIMSQLWTASRTLATYHFRGPESVLPGPDVDTQTNEGDKSN